MTRVQNFLKVSVILVIQYSACLPLMMIIDRILKVSNLHEKTLNSHSHNIPPFPMPMVIGGDVDSFVDLKTLGRKV